MGLARQASQHSCAVSTLKLIPQLSAPPLKQAAQLAPIAARCILVYGCGLDSSSGERMSLGLVGTASTTGSSVASDGSRAGVSEALQSVRDGDRMAARGTM